MEGRFRKSTGDLTDAFQYPDMKGDTSSTRAPSRLSKGTQLAKDDHTGVKEEEALTQFLSSELKTYFGQKGDATLFIKVLFADGIVTYLLVRKWGVWKSCMILK